MTERKGTRENRLKLQKLDADLKELFLNKFREHGLRMRACKETGIAFQKVTIWMERDGDFASRFYVANQEITETCEAAALTRAVNGIAQPVFHQGKKVGEIKVYSDRLLELILKARDRKKYSDRIENDFDERVGDRLVQIISTHFVNVVRRIAPDICPHCKTKILISTEIANEMMNLSGKIRV